MISILISFNGYVVLINNHLPNKAQTLTLESQGKLTQLSNSSQRTSSQETYIFIQGKKMHIYEDILNRIDNADQEEDDYVDLHNNTNHIPWLSTPRINDSIEHRVIIEPGSNGQVVITNTDRYSEIDLESHSSGASTVYTRPNPQSKRKTSIVIKDTKTVKQGNNKTIKIHYIILQVLFITLMLILLSHITCIRDF